MKFLLKISTMMILFNIASAQASNSFPSGKPVFFELILNKKSVTRPYLILHAENYCDQDTVRTQFKIIYPVEKTGNHYFFALADQHELQYFSIMATEKGKQDYLVRNYHFEPGDDVVITLEASHDIAGFELNFSGIGAAKYRCLSEYNDRILLDSSWRGALYTSNGSYNPNNRYVRNTKLLLEVVEKFQPELSDDSYALLKTDVICKAGREMILDFQERISAVTRVKPINHLAAYLRFSPDYRKNTRFKFLKAIPDKIKYLSKEYAQLMVAKHVADDLDHYNRINFIGVYNQIAKTVNTDLRDKMITVLFMMYKQQMNNDYKSLLDYALTQMQNSDCISKLIHFDAMD